jgi:uncharacterized membrane protein
MKASKFFKLCISSNEVPETLLEDIDNLSQEQIVKNYRDLLNYMSRLFVKLNQGADQLQTKRGVQTEVAEPRSQRS